MKVIIKMENIYERSQDMATSIKEGDHSFFYSFDKKKLKKNRTSFFFCIKENI
jgi:hypothetical protein